MAAAKRTRRLDLGTFIEDTMTPPSAETSTVTEELTVAGTVDALIPVVIVDDDQTRVTEMARPTRHLGVRLAEPHIRALVRWEMQRRIDGEPPLTRRHLLQHVVEQWEPSATPEMLGWASVAPRVTGASTMVSAEIPTGTHDRLGIEVLRIGAEHGVRVTQQTLVTWLLLREIGALPT